MLISLNFISILTINGEILALENNNLKSEIKNIAMLVLIIIICKKHFNWFIDMDVNPLELEFLVITVRILNYVGLNVNLYRQNKEQNNFQKEKRLSLL